MKTSPTTSPTTSSSEGRVREALLTVLHAQWRALGVPFSSAPPATCPEVIDPEALLWCSLEFIDREPRLAEGVRAWVAANRARLIGERIIKLVRASPDDARGERWRALLDEKRPRLGRRRADDLGIGSKQPGRQAGGPSTLLLRARDLLGNDCRSFLIVFLLGSERGLRLRELSKWTGYSYRAISEAATGWERAGVVHISHGHCVLAAPTPWSELLGCQRSEIVTIDWPAAYQAPIELLRTLAKAREQRFAAHHQLILSAIATTVTALTNAAAGAETSRVPTLNLLRSALEG